MSGIVDWFWVWERLLYVIAGFVALALTLLVVLSSHIRDKYLSPALAAVGAFLIGVVFARIVGRHTRSRG